MDTGVREYRCTSIQVRADRYEYTGTRIQVRADRYEDTDIILKNVKLSSMFADKSKHLKN